MAAAKITPANVEVSVGAAIGSSLGKLVDGQQLLFLFAFAMIAVGMAMLRPRAAAGDPNESAASTSCIQE
jgi:uncharacterized membrane protein YfcA